MSKFDEPIALLEAAMRRAIETLPDANPPTAAFAKSIQRLLDSHAKLARQAAKAEWHEAMAAVSAELPLISKGISIKFTSRTSGQSVSYSYADLSSIVGVLRPVLAAHGLSLQFSIKQDDDASSVVAICHIAHAAGHTVPFASPKVPITPSKMLSPAQSVGIAMTIARRYTLLAAFNLASTDDEKLLRTKESQDRSHNQAAETIRRRILNTGTSTDALAILAEVTTSIRTKALPPSEQRALRDEAEAMVAERWPSSDPKAAEMATFVAESELSKEHLRDWFKLERTAIKDDPMWPSNRLERLDSTIKAAVDKKYPRAVTNGKPSTATMGPDEKPTVEQYDEPPATEIPL